MPCEWGVESFWVLLRVFFVCSESLGNQFVLVKLF